MSFVASRLGADTVVRDMSTEALEAAAVRLAALAASQPAGFGRSLPVTEGVVWRAMQQEALAQRLHEAHQARWVRALQEAPEVPRFTEGMGLTGWGTAPESHAVGMAVGGQGEGITYVDGIPLVDPSWLDAPVGGLLGPHGPGGHDLPPGPGGELPWGGPSGGATGPGPLPDLDRLRFLPDRCRGDGSVVGVTPACPEPPVGSTAGEVSVTPTPLELPDSEAEEYGFGYYPPTSPHPCRMVLLLHGKGEQATDVDNIAKSYAAAGYRVLAIDWPSNACTARTVCAAAGANGSDEAWDSCLVEERTLRMQEVMIRTRTYLLMLADLAPEEGWGDFLIQQTVGIETVDWSKIILAGFSEGANQQAFNLRGLPAAGAIFLSGGGGMRLGPTTAHCRPIARRGWTKTSPSSTWRGG